MRVILFVIMSIACFILSCNNSSSTGEAISGDNTQKDTCCTKKAADSLQSEITCPQCGHKKMESMPTDACIVRYTCEKCKTDMFPKEGDCCVYCSYGSVKCPSRQ